MKILAACAVFPLILAGVDALAQADPIERLRACSAFASAERVDCLEKLSRDMGPPPATATAAPTTQAPPAADNWIVSQTTSPFDYSPIAVATVSTASSPDGVPLQLSIQCRGGGTELVLAGAPIKPRGEGYAVAYRIDDGAPVPLATGASASGTGVAIKGDVARLLASLPDHGTISFRIAAHQGATLEGRYALAGLNAALKRLAGPCKWPVVAQPANDVLKSQEK
jgi:hypothetical protein